MGENVDKTAFYFKKDIGPIPEPARDLLINYSGIPAEEIEAHISRVRDAAWKISPYPCIGSCLFLRLSINRSPQYPEVQSRLKQSASSSINDGEKLLDLGCGLGQDIRRIVYDGAPSEDVFGLDLEAGLIDAGYDLFLDRGRLKSSFVTADVLGDTSASQPGDYGNLNDQISQLTGNFNIIFAGSFFFLFNWSEQLKIAKKCTQLLKQEPGSLIFGHMLGHIEPDHYPKVLSPGEVYGHDTGSWRRMWEEVGDATGSKWRVEAELGEESAPAAFTKEGKWGDPGRRFMTFAVWRE